MDKRISETKRKFKHAIFIVAGSIFLFYYFRLFALDEHRYPCNRFFELPEAPSGNNFSSIGKYDCAFYGPHLVNFIPLVMFFVIVIAFSANIIKKNSRQTAESSSNSRPLFYLGVLLFSYVISGAVWDFIILASDEQPARLLMIPIFILIPVFAELYFFIRRKLGKLKAEDYKISLFKHLVLFVFTSFLIFFASVFNNLSLIDSLNKPNHHKIDINDVKFNTDPND